MGTYIRSSNDENDKNVHDYGSNVVRSRVAVA